MQTASLGDLVSIQTGKLDANASSPDGVYPFFTCAREPLRIANWKYDLDAVLVAGNGDLNVKHYKGKFDAYQRTYIISAKNESALCTRYLFYFMDSYLETLREQSIGGIIKYIKLGMLTDAKIPLPPLEEQKRIAAILDQADDIRRKRQHAIDRLNQLGQAIFHEMFGDPVTNPMGWDKVKFRDIVADETGGNIKTLQSDYLSSGKYPIVDQGQEQIGGYTNEADRVCKAELPVTVFGDHTKCFKFIDFPFCLGADGTKILKSKGQVDDLYLFYAIQKIHIPDAGYSRHFKYLKDGEISLPDLQHQRQFSNLIREIEGRINKMVLGNSASESLFASLQHRAFTGQL
jgi:type I restriction enzyme S subunit